MAMPEFELSYCAFAQSELNEGLCYAKQKRIYRNHVGGTREPWALHRNMADKS